MNNRKGIFRTYLFSALLCFGHYASAALDNKGTEFILAFIPNFDEAATIELHLTSDTPTDVTVEYPVNSPTFNTTVAVNPGDITIVTLPIGASSAWAADSVQNNAVHAFADEEFVAYLINRRDFSTDAALGLPLDTFNTEYIVATYDAAFIGGEFAVYAGFDNTTVTITPTNDLVGRSAGVPFDVVLNRGEGYFARSASSAGASGSLAGTLVSADRPVGVVNGNGCTQVPFGTTACDHIFEVAQPVQSWGSTILVSNLPNRSGGSIYRILASLDNTTVTQDGAAIGVIDRGEFFETPPLPGNHVFSADNPIYVIQFMTGQDASGAVLGDPAMGNMVPFEQYLPDYTFSTVGGGQFAENYVTIIARNSDEDTLLLDGSPLAPGSFTAIPGSDFSAAVVAVSEGTHATSSPSTHGITVEGFNSFDSYIYPGGALFDFINPVGDANPPVCNSNLLAGPPPALEGDGQDNRPSEDTNDNGVLDPGEDLNGNGLIDEDTGIFFVELEPGAVNLDLSVSPFTPGDGTVEFTVALQDPNVSGSGDLLVTDGAGNSCSITVDLFVSSKVCDVDLDGDIDRLDIDEIFAARNTPASGPDDPRDADGNGTINVLDARQCVLQCTNENCAVN